MNISMWTAMREYIAAETELAVCRYARRNTVDYDQRAVDLDARIAELQEQSTRMETAVRGYLEQPL